jgi:hypothetical protein
MKKIITFTALSLIVISFFSCGIVREYKRADLTNWKSQTLKELCREVRLRVKYVSDEGDYWQSAGETEMRLKGDCEDYAILFMDIITQWGYSCEMLCIKSYVGAHAIVYCNGIYYDPTSGVIMPNPPEKVYYGNTFEEVVRLIESGCRG